jgi:hypothetical protein
MCGEEKWQNKWTSQIIKLRQSLANSFAGLWSNTGMNLDGKFKEKLRQNNGW